jgi:hypothetical protein
MKFKEHARRRLGNANLLRRIQQAAQGKGAAFAAPGGRNSSSQAMASAARRRAAQIDLVTIVRNVK